LSVNSWYKGNIHTHTTESDGDAEPEKVVRWFRRHGYDFLVLSDHNHRTILEYGPGKRRLKRPLMIPGEEVSVNIRNGEVPIHINAIGISRMVEPIDASEVVPTIQANVDAIVRAGGIASINHPNYGWAFDHEQIKQVTGASLLEVFNGIPETNVYGGPGKPSNEQIWNGVLDAGRVIFGVATDDSHNYHDFAPEKYNPGRGWVMVRAPELTRDAIVEALASGDFYSSTGVTLTSLDLSQESIHLKIQQRYDYIYSTTFTGRGGVVLAEVAGLEATYRLRGNEGYVRAVVVNSGSNRAWTQPVFTGG
jgi:hypothetical protein